MNQKEIQEMMKKLDSVAGVNALFRVFTKLDTVGRNVLIRALGTEMSDVSKRQFVTLITQEAVKADADVKDWVAKGLTKTYVAGMNQTAQNLLDLKVKGISKSDVKITVDLLTTSTALAPHLKAVNTLMSDAYLDFAGGITGYVKGAERILNDQLKRQIRSNIALGRLEGEAVRDIARTVKETLSDKGFTVLIGKSGRQWELKQYAEMLTRTHVIKANNEGVLNRAGDFKVDIVEVSSHGSDDELCASEEGKIYSISGKSDNYPPLAGHEPPFHPNCRHTLLMRPDLE